MFVTRAHHADVVAQLHETLQQSREEFLQQLRYNQTLVQQIVEMRREGFTKPDAAPTMAPRAPDPVSDAINVIAGNNIRERTRLGRVVSLWRAKGRDTDEIVHELLNPAPDEDGVSA